ncbi:MAG TPA: ABC transporter permease [Spirochaetia bacterium]|nr:ABC transporter permease [Spirochaetia bacterium]
MTFRASLLLTIRYVFGSRSRRAPSRPTSFDRRVNDEQEPGAPNAIPLVRRRRGRVRGAIAGIAVSLVPLVVVLEVADGMIQGITSRFIEVGTYHIEAISAADSTPAQMESLAAEISRVPGVTEAVPERQGLGLIASTAGRTGTTIRAIDPQLFADDSAFRRYVHVSAGVFDLSTENSIVVGTEIARKLGLSPGDTVRLITVRSFGGSAFLPKISTFTVRGIFSTGYQELDKLWVFIPFARGARILPAETSRSIIGIKVSDPFAIANPLFSVGTHGARSVVGIVRAIQEQLSPDWRLYSWYELEKSQYMSFVTTKNLLVFIMILIVAVASVNISSSMVMLVMEKQDEIAILKALGASPRGIRTIFLLAGFAAGALGTFAGIAIGLFFAVNINEVISGLQWALNAGIAIGQHLMSPFGRVSTSRVDIFNPEFYLQTIPIRIRVSEVFLASFLSILLSTAASYFPARRAGNIRPLSIMRKH